MKIYLLLLSFLTIISVSLFVFTGLFTSPTNKEGTLIPINLAYFFISALFSLAGVIGLMLYWLGNLRLKSERKNSPEAINRPKLILKNSLRQGLIFSSTVVSIGLLNALNFANPISVVLVIIVAVLIEVYFFGH